MQRDKKHLFKEKRMKTRKPIQLKKENKKDWQGRNAKMRIAMPISSISRKRELEKKIHTRTKMMQICPQYQMILILDQHQQVVLSVLLDQYQDLPITPKALY